MSITATEFKMNLGKYLLLSQTEDIYITKNGKVVATGAEKNAELLEKLVNISRNYISYLKAEEVYDRVLTWANTYDKEFSELLTKYKEYTINLFSIERYQKKPRKDFESWSTVKNNIWYMYDELFKDFIANNIHIIINNIVFSFIKFITFSKNCSIKKYLHNINSPSFMIKNEFGLLRCFFD